MQDRFFGDRKDVWKWSVAINAALEHPQARIIYVAMLRKDFGNDFAEVPKARRDVRDFFAEQREQWHLETRRVERVTQLKEATGVDIILIGQGFSARTRAKYFRAVCEKVSATRDRCVVLIDPDNGLPKGEEAKPHHISPDELKAVWRDMKKGDTLVLYQSRWHLTGWQEALRRIVAGELGCSVGEVHLHPDPEFCLFQVTKPAGPA